MTKTELKKLKELDAFLKERNMKLSGRNVLVRFGYRNWGRAWLF